MQYVKYRNNITFNENIFKELMKLKLTEDLIAYFMTFMSKGGVGKTKLNYFSGYMYPTVYLSENKIHVSCHIVQNIVKVAL